MKNRRKCMGILVIVLVFGFMIVGCDDESTKGNTYYYEAFKITLAQYNSFMSNVTPGYTYTFNQIIGFRQTLRSFSGTFFGSGTGASETELSNFMTSSGISPSEYKEAKKSLDSVGNLIYFFQDQSGNVIWFYFEKE